MQGQGLTFQGQGLILPRPRPRPLNLALSPRPRPNITGVMTATVCFKRKSNICIGKFGNLGANGVKGSKFLDENVIFGIADPDLPIPYAIFMGLR